VSQDLTKSIRIQEIPGTLFCCAECGQPMRGAEYRHPETKVQFWCATMKCHQRGLIVELTLPRVYPAQVVGTKDDLCQCERCIPKFDG
jgi:hypothetical protein